MKIYHENLGDVDRYLETHRNVPLEEKRRTFEGIMAAVQRYKTINAQTEMIEIGTGTGWLPILCQMSGWRCKGLEISPQLVEFAKQLGAPYGIVPDIVLGNLEDTDLGQDTYDVIITSNVFEHVENWRLGVRKVYEALKPGGVMFFESTNKFSFTSGEYDFPLYGWMPNSMRYKLRIARQGEDIMKLGIDFHQFTHGGLRREFKAIGFRKIYDRVQMADEAYISAAWRKHVVRIGRVFPPAKWAALTFGDVTRFVCIK